MIATAATIGLPVSEDPPLPIDPETMFSDHKGVERKSIKKRQLKWLRKISFLREFLEPDEKILLITPAVTPCSIWEQLLTGWIHVYLKRCLLVFTNKRILHIPTKRNYGYRRCIAQIMYGDCETMTQKGGRLVLDYKLGDKETFLHIPSKEGRRIREFLGAYSFNMPRSMKGRRHHLCPSCTMPLDTDFAVCQKCRLEFKSPDRALRLSILLPGGGYFYTGHPLLGIADAVVELFLILVLGSAVSGLLDGMAGSSSVLAVYGTLLVVEKAITVFHANRFVAEFLPNEKLPKAA